MPRSMVAKIFHQSGARTLRRREAIYGYLFAAPWLIGFFGLTLGPILTSLILSFTNYTLLAPPHPIGPANYTKLFAHDALFWISIGNTVYYTIFTVPLSVVIALLLALLLNQPIKGVRIFRTIFYLPAVTSNVAVVLLWGWLLNPNVGLVDRALEAIGLPGPGWFSSETWSKPGLILLALWSVGQGVVVYLAGLQAVPQTLYEAAAIDGAGPFRRFWHITVPGISPTIFFNLVLSVIASFQVFTPAFVLTQGGPLNSTLFYVLYMFQQGFQYLQMGYASAMAWILLVVVLTITLIQFAFSGRWVYYEGESRR